MSSDNELSEEQLAVIEALFSEQLSEREVLEKHNVSRENFNKWLGEREFTQAFARKLKQSRMETMILISRYSSAAIKKLIELTESEKQETARKACLDILNLQADNIPEKSDTEDISAMKHNQLENLPEEKVSKLLEILAEKEGD